MENAARTTAQELYEEEKKVLEASRKQAIEAQSVTLERLKKYLPEMARASGRLSPSENDVARLYARYAGSVGDIEKSYAEQQSQLLQRYYTNKQAERDQLYDIANAKVQNWTGDNDSLRRYLDGVRGSLSEEQQLNLETEAERYTSDPLAQQSVYESKRANEELAELQRKEAAALGRAGSFTYKNGVGGLDSVGNNFTLVDEDGEKYRVESGGAVDEASENGYYVAKKAKVLEDGAVFSFENEIYIKKGGKVYLIKGRPSSAKGHDALAAKFGA